MKHILTSSFFKPTSHLYSRFNSSISSSKSFIHSVLYCERIKTFLNLKSLCRSTSPHSKTAIYSSNGSHSGSHPVTMQALQTPTPPRPRPTSQPSPATETVPIHTSVHSSTPGVSPAVDNSPTPAQQASCADESEINSEQPDVHPTLTAENTALKEELAKLRMEMQVVLDHSIESDQRLLQYTEEVFSPPPSLTSASPNSTETQRIKEELEKPKTTLKNLKN